MRSLPLDKIVNFCALHLEVNTLVHFNVTLCFKNALIINRTAQIILDNFNFFFKIVKTS